MFSTRSYALPRHTAAVIPTVSASGTTTIVVSSASSSEFASRPLISSAIDMPFTSDVPGLPLSSPNSQCR